MLCLSLFVYSSLILLFIPSEIKNMSVLGKNSFLHQKVTISHQISYVFAPNFTTFSHQILSLADHVFAPILLRFRTNYNLFIHYFGLGQVKAGRPLGRESSPQGLDKRFLLEIDLNLVRNRPKIWCEIDLFNLLILVRNRPEFGAKST